MSSADTVLRAQRITKQVSSPEGTLTILAEVDLEIAAGETVAIIGASGAGKSTLLALLAGLDEPSNGRIWLNGAELTALNEDGRAAIRARHVGFVFQSFHLVPSLTAIENVEFGLRMRGIGRAERRERARHYLQLVGLSGQERKYPAELSGGMKQRIQIARALVNEPAMLLMDEPFAALDAQTRTLMQEELANLWQATRTTVLFITHDIDEAVTLGTRIGVMRAGPRSDVKGVIDVALDGARSRTDDAFLKYYKQVYEMIRDEVAASIVRGVR